MKPGLNARAIARLNALFDGAFPKAADLNIAVVPDDHGATVVDFGVSQVGGLGAGLELARICLAGLAEVRLAANPSERDPGLSCLPRIEVATDQPLAACMGSQYAGWPVSIGDFFAIGSGPMRGCRGKEPMLHHYGLVHPETQALGVLECDVLPEAAVVQAIAEECHIAPRDLYLCVAPTKSLAGASQIVARSVEATLHKLQELQVDLSVVKHAFGSAPLPPPSPIHLTALGRTNDSILYGADVTLWVDLDDSAIEDFGEQLPSNSSAAFGNPFEEVFQQHGGDFYKLDPHLFSAARISICSLVSGHVQTFGELRPDVLVKSFFPARTTT